MTLHPGPESARTVVVVRHAHAAGTGPGGDHERPLDERGRREATAAGRWLAGLELGIELVLCSTATRAGQTWAAMAAAFDPAPTLRAEDVIYDAGVDDLVQLINDASARTLVLVGHNPTVSALVAELDPDFDHALRPAAIAVIELTDESGVSGGHVVRFWTPPGA